MTSVVVQAPALSYAGSVVQTAYGNVTVDANGLAAVDSRAVNALLGAGWTTGRVLSGSHVVTAGEAAANQVVIATGLTSVVGQTVQCLTNANVVEGADAVITHAAGNVTVADGATYNTVAGHIINWIAFGF